MKLMQRLLAIGLLSVAPITAATISGQVFCDQNADGFKDDNETCTQESVWIKMIEDEKWVTVQGPLYNEDINLSGKYEFSTGRTGIDVRVIIDNNSNSQDTSATPPPNMVFTIDPDSPFTEPFSADGEATYSIISGDEEFTDQDYGMFFGGDCVCDDADGNVTKKTISIDGNISDWSSVYADPDNNICDYGCSQDKDAPVQSTGRNLVQFTWTGDDLYAYGYTYRVGSTSNTQTFLYYADRDGDGLMGDGMDVNGTWMPDFAIEAGWQGNTGTVSLTFYPYIPADEVNFDPMVWTQEEIDSGKLAPGGQVPDSTWVGSGDGYTLNGSLDTTNSVDITGADGSAVGVTVASGGIDDAGVKMEWRLRWAFLNLEPFQRITYHVSAMNASVTSTNPPGQIDENMAGCYGEAVLEYCGVTLVPDRNITLSATQAATIPYVYFEHNLTNTGNAADTMTLNLIQTDGNFSVAYIEYYNDVDGNGIFSPGDINLTADGNVTLAQGESINLLVKIGLPGGLNDNYAIGEINASTTSCEINHSAVVYDSITVNPLSFDLEVVKKVSDDNATWVDTIGLLEGVPAAYQITVTNNGPVDDATGVTLNDLLPTDVTYVSHVASVGTYNPGAGQWSIGDLANGDSATLTIYITTNYVTASKTVQNIACTTDTNDTDSNDCDDANITLTHTPLSDLQVTKTVNNPMPYETEDINYTITVTNFGPDTAVDVVVNDLLPVPDYVTYAGDYNASVGTLSPDGTVWTIGDMAFGAVETLVVHFTVDSGAAAHNPHDNLACAVTTTIDTNLSNNCGTARFIASNEVDVAVDKTVDISYPRVGDTITYTVTATNNGPIAVTNLVIEEEDLTWLNVTGHTASLGTYVAPNWTIPELNVTQTATLTITGTVNSSGTFTNTAQISSLDQNDTNGTNDSGSATIGTPSIAIEKSTNGEDADAAPGPYIPLGAPVSWEYVVTNTGYGELSSIVVTDDQGVAVDCNGTTILAQGETMICSASGTAVEGQYTNLGSVIATITTTGLEVNASDPSHYFGDAPVIDIEKSTNGVDADAAPGPFIAVGAAVTWTYVVTNGGNVALETVAVIDSEVGAVTCPKTTLAIGESMTCTANGTAVAGQYSNTGSVTANSVNTGQQVSDSDLSHYYGAAPAIGIEKSTNGVDADTVTGPFILVGNSVTWTYVVSNLGNVALDTIAVTDSEIGVINCPQTTLAVGANMTCTASGTAVLGQYSNLGTVTAVAGVTGQQVGDEDPSHYYGAAPAIDIEKSTNGEDADAAPGPYIPVGDPVTWEYVVTNSGNEALNSIVVTDDRGVTVDCNGTTTLAAGESMTCTASGTAVAGQYNNTGSVTATSLNTGIQLSANDPSHYYGAAPAIDIEKSTNGMDADTSGTGPTLIVGDPVNWTYLVTNTGNVPLNAIVVTDDQGVTVSCPESTLAAGASMTCTASGTVTEGEYENNGSVSGWLYPNEIEVTDSDLSHYTGIVGVDIGDFVWYDDDNNGIQDKGEDPVEGFTVELLDENGIAMTDINGIGSVETDENGKYSFFVRPGTYILRFSPANLPENYIFTQRYAGGDESIDSDADAATGESDPVTVSTVANYDVDAGIYCTCYDMEKSDSGSALGTISASLMMLMTLMVGLYFVRREELNQNRR
ncbi:DUF7507 domain-containing protein [Sulfurovum mangrovi]|uniref:DUF7507 domain-containing protein n=1 Tax=Sulfurovum mangrovi TaxID=2893889 RepID=UPI001E3E7EED|nr:SdrD B-like domain-containing protein [Sulfurovum mangrovi]UFH59182.1 DUF11 domain-containing protein [Sulfurovum mangrovi]